MPKILLTTLIPGWSLEEIFSFANEAKFDGIEYVIKLPDLLKDLKSKVELSRRYNIPILCVHQPLLSILYTPPFLYKPLIITAKTLGAEAFVAHSSSLLNPIENRTVKFNALLKGEGIRCCFESNNSQFPFRFYPKTTYKPWVFGEFFKKNNLAMTLDTSHVSCYGVDIVDFFIKYPETIKHIHLSDYDNGSEHLILGEGKLPIKKFLQALKRHNYKDFITFEIRQSNKNSSKQYLKEKIRENLLFLRSIISG